MDPIPPRMTSDGRIFVGIAAYRDPDCQWTVKDLFDKAVRPDRVFVGICWQLIPGRDDDCRGLRTRPGQVREATFHATRESRGACWARHQVQKLWRGEEYFLQIDSHCRFEPGWDARYIEMLRACPSPRPVLTTYPAGFEPPDKLGTKRITYMTADRFHDTGVLINSSWTTDMRAAPSAPVPTALLAAGQVFAPGRIVEEVPYDPYIYFQGEEISMAVRLWTHGWDLYLPNDCLLYHDYTAGRNDKRHWSDNRDWPPLSRRGTDRVMHLLGTRRGTEAATIFRLDEFGLGPVRSLAEYERHAGIDFAHRRIEARAAEGRFPHHPSLDAGARRRREESAETWRSNRFGSRETHSGADSNFGATRKLREGLAEVLRTLGIRTLADMGCGDLHWIAPVTAGLDLYLGFDLAEAAIDENLKVFRDRKTHLFQVADVVVDRPPRTDAVLCRDLFTFLDDGEIRNALGTLRAGGARYLIATTHPGQGNRPGAGGTWRPLDLEAPPFSLPPPLLRIADGALAPRKELAVWAFAHLTV
jgi:hypothetical protein